MLSFLKKDPELFFYFLTSIIFFFAFVPGCESISKISFTIFFLIYVAIKNTLKKSRLIKIIFLGILSAFLLHALIGLTNIFNVFYSSPLSSWLNMNPRTSLVIGVKNFSIVCCFLMIFSIHLLKQKDLLFVCLGKIFALIAISGLALSNSLTGLATVLFVSSYEFFISIRTIKAFRRARINLFKFLLISIALAFALFPFSGGIKGRILQLPSTIEAISNNNTQISWITPHRFNDEFCKVSDCTIDASLYYRVSWIAYGVKIIEKNPMGLGFKKAPLESELKKEFPDLTGMYSTDFHSDLITFVVGLGLFGVLILLSIFILLFYFLSSLQGSKIIFHKDFLIGCLICFFTRFTFDSVGRYLMLCSFLVIVLSVAMIFVSANSVREKPVEYF